MSLFNRIMVENRDDEPVKQRSPFSMEIDRDYEARACIMLRLPGSNGSPRTIWSRDFYSQAELHDVLAQIKEAGIELGFWGRLVLLLGPSSVDAEIDRIVATHRERVAHQEEEQSRRAAARQRVQSCVSDKNGWYYLTLERETDDEPEWKIGFRGKAERERLRDWFRWQTSRFLEFLDYAANHGAAALEKRLLDEMFAAEQRVKQEGRGAGGTRPLRMWRGE